MHALCADSQTHQIIKHLGMGHMMCETFAIAHHNAYILNSEGEKNRIGAMLAPHVKHLIAINSLAR